MPVLAQVREQYTHGSDAVYMACALLAELLGCCKGGECYSSPNLFLNIVTVFVPKYNQAKAVIMVTMVMNLGHYLRRYTLKMIVLAQGLAEGKQTYYKMTIS